MNSSPTVAGRREPLAHPMALAIPRVVVLVIAAYIAAQMIADVASTKIGLVLGLSVDMGTFIYPITFTLRDLAHKTMGKKKYAGVNCCGRGCKFIHGPIFTLVGQRTGRRRVPISRSVHRCAWSLVAHRPRFHCR